VTPFAAELTAVAALCCTGAILSLLAPPRRAAQVVALLGTLAALAVIALGASALMAASPATLALWTVPSVGTVMIHRDPVSGVFLLVSGLVYLPASVFAAGAVPALLPRYSVRAYGVLHFALLAVVVWVLTAGDVFSFLVVWEIMSVLSYLLVTFEYDEDAHRSAGYLMLALGEAGALAAALGLLLLAVHAGALDFSALRASAATAPGGLRTTVFLLTFFGFGVKAGLVPVNGWLPRAYAAAPRAFVPVLAGATLNLGLYGIIRVNADLLPATSTAPGFIALIVGTASALLGILYATTSDDMKTLLAHSSIENAGIVTAGFGASLVFSAAHQRPLAAVALLVALYHLVNHSLYKTLLFIGSGAVDAHAGTRSLDRLGGLIHRMPWTALAMLAGVLSIAALPPFNGFVSEWLTLQTFLRSAQLSSVAARVVFALCGAGLALTAALAVTCFAKLFAMGFLGMPRTAEAARATETSPSTLLPLTFLASLCLLLGTLPTYVISALDRAVRPVMHASGLTALVPPFFAHAPGHDALPPAFVRDFRDIGAQVGQGVVPGPGLVILHRGGPANPVVFAGAPTYLILVLAGSLVGVFLILRLTVARGRTVARRAAWDGGVRRLLPEMTYTATGFSNPVRVIFQAIFRPTLVEDTREVVAEHFRTAIRRQVSEVHVVERLVLRPASVAAFGIARTLARMHHGRLNAYIAYALLSLLGVLVVFAAVRLI